MSNYAGNTWEALFDKRWGNSAEAAPQSLQNWLLSEGSLTVKLTAACQQEFTVKLLHQSLCLASAAAASALDIPEGGSLLHREVLLCDGDTPLVFACSLLPELALTGSYEELRQLDNRPLGHWIFAEPALTRARMQFARLPTDDALFVRAGDALASQESLWGRATCFSGAAASLLVSEFFVDESFFL